MNTWQQPRTSHRREAGMISIIVTLILMLVISLIVLGFATVSRREQRSSLDRQLSAQAFFAAESGINDARKVIIAKVKANEPIPEKTDCKPNSDYNGSAPAYSNPSNKLNADGTVSYPCLLVSTKLRTLTVSPVTAGGSSTSLPLEPDGVMTNLHIDWQALSTPLAVQIAKCKGAGTSNDAFPRNNVSEWECPYGVVRMDIVPIGPTLSRLAMSSTNPLGQKTIFFYPTNNSSEIIQPYALSNGAVAEMKCQEATGCDVDVNGIPNGNYMLRISGIYVDGAVTITAQSVIKGPDLDLKNGQVEIDVTGKAQDVLRRIQVRLPIASVETPDYALQSGSSICKRFLSSPLGFSIPSISNQDTNNPMCRPL